MNSHMSQILAIPIFNGKEFTIYLYGECNSVFPTATKPKALW